MSKKTSEGHKSPTRANIHRQQLCEDYKLKEDLYNVSSQNDMCWEWTIVRNVRSTGGGEQLTLLPGQRRARISRSHRTRRV